VFTTRPIPAPARAAGALVALLVLAGCGDAPSQPSLGGAPPAAHPLSVAGAVPVAALADDALARLAADDPRLAPPLRALREAAARGDAAAAAAALDASERAVADVAASPDAGGAADRDALALHLAAARAALRADAAR
jgi:hypothetical protein